MLVLNLPFKALMFLTLMRPSLVLFLVLRSEERRVGKECRSCWAPGRYKKTRPLRRTTWPLQPPAVECRNLAKGWVDKAVPFCFFKQKTAYEFGLGIPAEPLFRSCRHG